MCKFESKEACETLRFHSKSERARSRKSSWFETLVAARSRRDFGLQRCAECCAYERCP